MATPPSYEWSGVVYEATGDQTEYALTSSAGKAIGYLLPEHISVSTSDDDGETWTVLATPADYTFSTQGTRVVLTSAPALGTWVLLKRSTPMDDNWVDYQSGNLLTAGQLNEFESWQLYIDQELADQASNSPQVIAGVEPIQVDSTNTRVPVVSIDETDSTGDPNQLTSDTKVMSEKAIDEAFCQYVGTGPAEGKKVGQVRIDPTGLYNTPFYWNGGAWVQIGTDGGPPGPPGPPPGLQDPPAEATTVPLNPDGSLGEATALISQDPLSYELKFLFGIPQGLTGDTGPQGPPGEGITYLGIVDATTAAEPASPNNGDFWLNDTNGTSTWTGLSTVQDGDRLIWNSNSSQWDRFEAPDLDPDFLKKGDNVSELTNDAGYITAADIPPVASTLQEVLDNGNTSTTDLWIGANGETVKLLNTGSVEATGGITGAFGTSSAQLGNVMPRDDWSSIPARS